MFYILCKYIDMGKPLYYFINRDIDCAMFSFQFIQASDNNDFDDIFDKAPPKSNESKVKWHRIHLMICSAWWFVVWQNLLKCTLLTNGNEEVC